jgi:excisionase family DNA binding protein
MGSDVARSSSATGKAEVSNETILLTARQVAELTGFSEGTVRHWTSQQRIPFVRISGHCVRFRRGDIEAWVASKVVTPAATTARQSRKQQSK